ncbi:peptide ligase PGM1-related protein [Streptomyces eurythermus]|uniref:preATP grasp domain-containing protein n=1 Tax=Streptomyces eurythermus TaxID=42237 RepID=UPI003403F684
MTALHIGNTQTEEMSGDPALLSAEQLRFSSASSHRVLWFARDGDVAVVPVAPQETYVAYVTGLTGVDASSLRLVVPPAGHIGGSVLTSDRLADAAFRAELRTALGGRPPTRVQAYYPDAAVVSLARALGAAEAVPGHAFLAQGGAVNANSKALFRAVAAGLGIPVAPGAIAAWPWQAERAVTEQFEAGYPVMLKQELHSASEGNEILSPEDGLSPFGAERVVVLQSPEALRTYLDERWSWLTDDGRGRVIVERYVAGARAGYAEYLVTDDGVEFTGEGELLMAPLLDGIVIPIPDLAAAARTGLRELTRRLCEAYRAIGYRGTMSVDGLITPEGGVLLNETNSRLSGSTHLHGVIGPRLAGPGRTLLDRGGLAVPSFAEAVARLSDSGLAFDPSSRTGAILTCDYTHVNGTVRYCLVAADADAARNLERELREVFAMAARN